MYEFVLIARQSSLNGLSQTPTRILPAKEQRQIIRTLNVYHLFCWIYDTYVGAVDEELLNRWTLPKGVASFYVPFLRTPKHIPQLMTDSECKRVDKNLDGISHLFNTTFVGSDKLPVLDVS